MSNQVLVIGATGLRSARSFPSHDQGHENPSSPLQRLPNPGRARRPVELRCLSNRVILSIEILWRLNDESNDSERRVVR